MTKPIRGIYSWVDPSFDKELGKFAEKLNSRLPQNRGLSKKEASFIVAEMLKAQKLVVNVKIVENKKGKYAWKTGGRIDKDEFLI